MKPVVIIAIAVVCSVIAVLGVLVALQEYAFWQAQMTLEEYERKLRAEEERQKEIIRLEEEKQKEIENKRIAAEILARSQYQNLVVTEYFIPYKDCLDNREETFCKEILNDIVKNYCSEKLESFSVKTTWTHFLKCVSITNEDVKQDDEIAMESQRILKCFEDYAGRDGIASICIRTWQ
jgi:hypothetical protein